MEYETYKAMGSVAREGGDFISGLLCEFEKTVVLPLRDDLTMLQIKMQP